MTAGSDAFSNLLYPMLRDQRQADEALLVDLQDVALQKAREANRLRTELLAGCADDLGACSSAMAQRFLAGGTLLACGNGGSATAAADLVARLTNGAPSRRPLAALCLTADVANVTAIANDIGVAAIFDRQIMALGRSEDIVLGISTSGNSENVLRGLRVAARRGMLTVGLSGGDGGMMAVDEAVEYCFVVSSGSVHRIQEVQATVYGLLYDLVHQQLEF